MTRPRRRVYVHLTSTGPQETPDPFERGLVGFSRCHRTSHITRTLRVEARLASLVLRHLVRGVLLAPLAVGLLRFRHLFDRETVIILGQSLRAIFARALKRAMLRARRAPRRRRRRRDDAANDDALFRSRDRSLTFTISHTLARRREAYVGAIARDLDLDLFGINGLLEAARQEAARGLVVDDDDANGRLALLLRREPLPPRPVWKSKFHGTF